MARSEFEQSSADAMHHFTDKVSEFGANIADTVKTKAHHLKEKAKNIDSVVCDYVSENPWKAVGIGVAAGIVISQLLWLRK